MMNDHTANSIQIETHGLDFIPASDRHGKPLDLLWLYVAASIGAFGISYGAFVFAFGLDVWQSIIIGITGVAISSVFCGIVSLAGKRGNAPTMVLSRSIFGVRGNAVPNAISGIMSVGWETIQVVTASLATATVLGRLGMPSGVWTEVAAMLVIMIVVTFIGVFGYDMLVKSMKILTPLSIAITLGYLAMTIGEVKWAALAQASSGTTQAMIGAFMLMLAGSGVTLCRICADYSRYLPRQSSSAATVIWPIIGNTVPLALLLAFGVLLAGSNPDLGRAIANDPIGALTSLLPAWYFIPFALIVLITSVTACSFDIYSGSLSLLAMGVPVKRYQAILIVALITSAASFYILLSKTGFFVQFQGILITLGIPVAAWAGMMCTDVVLRRIDYDDLDLRRPDGRYGDIRWASLGVLALATILGWGLVTNTAAGWLDWQGYLLAFIGGRTGLWAMSNLGIIAAILTGIAGYLIVGWPRVRAQEANPAP